MTWRVVFTLDGVTFEASSEDPEPDSSYVGLLAPLRITRGVSGDFWPAQPDIASAQVSLLLEDAQPLLRQGAPVTLAVYAPHDAADPIEHFEGRIAEATSSAAGGLDAMVYTLTCVDYLADLAEPQVTQAEDWPAEASGDRLTRLFALGGIGATPTFPSDMLADDYTSPARPLATNSATRSLADRVEDCLFSWVSGMTTYTGAGPDQDGGRWVLTGDAEWSFGIIHKRPATGVYVLELDTSVSRYRPVLDLPTDPDRTVIIDGGVVDRSSQWSLLKNSGISAVQLRGPDDDTTGPVVVTLAQSVTPQLLATREDVDAPTSAMATAALVYLPDLSTVTWQPSSFVWLYYAETTPPALPALGDTVVIDGANPVWTPSPTVGGVIVGQLTSRTFTISSGRPVIEMATRWPQRAADAITWADLPDVPVSSFETGMTAVDFRLVRSTV